MQTFLPYSDFLLSAKVLDKKRCWKQVVEAKQIIDTLIGLQNPEIKELNITLQRKQFPWMNHPAVKMWKGHIPELKFYFNGFLISAIKNHKINTKYEPYLNWKEFIPRGLIHDPITLEMPWWLGNEDFHRAMRARLIEKDRNFYLPFFPNDEGFNDGKYLWPNMKTKTFKII
jgi:hypothetical protein